MKDRNEVLTIVLVACTISFLLTSCLAALWLSLYDFLRSHGMGFWQIVFLYAAFATTLSTATVLTRNRDS
jgi:hypothetical protein